MWPAKFGATGLCISALLLVAHCGQDYYDILGVGRDATNKEIRKAFKKLALVHHPDKSKEKDAEQNFMRINKAYETLKDEEKRKRYDRFGEEDEEGNGGGGGGGGGGHKSQHGKYQSWQYFHDDFGLYDDDPEVVTLSHHDFRRSVDDAYSFWFINFYSPQCGPCHDFAPTWRRVARQLDGVIRVGAVNCQDEFMLCRQQNIRSYPSLIFYGPDGAVHRFDNRREKEEERLLQFVAERLPNPIVPLNKATFKSKTKKMSADSDPLPWFILFCDDDDLKCPEKHLRRLLAVTLDRLVRFAVADCSIGKWCEDYTDGDNGAIFYADYGAIEGREGRRVQNSEMMGDMAKEVLEMLPDIDTLDDEEFASLRNRLEDGHGPDWLVSFVFGSDGKSLEQKKIAAQLPRIKFGRVDCSDSSMAKECKVLGIRRPQYVLFKVDGGHEAHYGRNEAPDVVDFARVSSQARKMRTLSETSFRDLIRPSSPSGVFVDFFAPWCPPCLNLLPEFRKAAINVGGSVVFGTVDCTQYPHLCNEYQIRSYPTTVFFNQSKPHFYNGEHSSGGLSEFVHEILRPSVINLDTRMFKELVENKPEDEMWLVDFYAPWCGPCMQLTPEWTRLAKLLSKAREVKVAKVDCDREKDLCRHHAIRSYPTMRLYPLQSRGTQRYFPYDGFRRDANSLRDWAVQYLPSAVESLTPYTYNQKVIDGTMPYLVDFYAPWCGPCQQFAPVFDDIGLSLRDDVKAGKVNCDRFQQLCRQLGIRSYPTVRYYSGSSYTELKNRDFDSIVDFVEQRLSEEGESRSKRLRHDEL